MWTVCDGEPWPPAAEPDPCCISCESGLYEVLTVNSDVRRRFAPAWWSYSVGVVGDRDIAREERAIGNGLRRLRVFPSPGVYHPSLWEFPTALSSPLHHNKRPLVRTGDVTAL